MGGGISTAFQKILLVLKRLACRQNFFKRSDALRILGLLRTQILDRARIAFCRLFGACIGGAKLLYDFPTDLELCCTLCVFRKLLHPLCLLRAFRLLFLCRLPCFLRCLKRCFCSDKTGICRIEFIRPTLFQILCPYCFAFRIEDRMCALCTLQTYAKIPHILFLRLFFCEVFLCSCKLL